MGTERYLLGCTGWGYDDWKGGFYPPGTPPSEYLERYARVFRLAEVDSSYYRAPSREQAGRWAMATPPGFLFTPKFPGDITHQAMLRNAEATTDAFLAALAPLQTTGKLGPCVLQFPHSFRRDKDEEALRSYLDALPRDLALAVELRHASWFVPETYRMLAARNAALVWGTHEHGRAAPVVTADFVYARLIGDRALTRFDRIQRDMTDEMRWWVKRFEDEGASAYRVYGLVNNHLMGFAPQSVVILANMLGVQSPDLAAAMRTPGQRSLFG